MVHTGQIPLQVDVAMAVLRCAMEGAGPSLLGSDLDAAREVLAGTLIGNGYPGFWMESPLLGKAGFDFHVSYDRADLSLGSYFAPEADPCLQRLVDWFVNEETGGVGLGFAYDVSSGYVDTPAAYVNTNHKPLDDEAGFFSATGHPELAPAVSQLTARLPESYRTWYLGVFSNRAGCPARIGCFLPEDVRRVCAEDSRRFARELARIGFDSVSETMLVQLRDLAQIPLPWEIQFDVYADGHVGDTLSLDLCLPLAHTVRVDEFFAQEGLGGQAMRVLEGWGVADGRWARIPHASFNRLARPRMTGKAFLLRCYPSFVKAKWTSGIPQAAKVYLQCVARPVVLPTHGVGRL